MADVHKLLTLGQLFAIDSLRDAFGESTVEIIGYNRQSRYVAVEVSPEPATGFDPMPALGFDISADGKPLRTY